MISNNNYSIANSDVMRLFNDNELNKIKKLRNFQNDHIILKEFQPNQDSEFQKKKKREETVDYVVQLDDYNMKLKALKDRMNKKSQRNLAANRYVPLAKREYSFSPIRSRNDANAIRSKQHATAS
jgi:hypothetical protein